MREGIGIGSAEVGESLTGLDRRDRGRDLERALDLAGSFDGSNVLLDRVDTGKAVRGDTGRVLGRLLSRPESRPEERFALRSASAFSTGGS